MGPAAHPSEEAPVPVGEAAVEREIRNFTDTVASASESGTVEETVTATEPIQVSPEAPAVETVPAQKDTEDPAPGVDSSLSVEKDTPAQSSSEQPEHVDAEEHVHTGAKVVDELHLHGNSETPEIQETRNVETLAVDVDSDVLVESLMKGESFHPEGEQIVEPSVASVNSSEEDIIDLSLKLGAVEETVMASGPTHVPQETLSVDAVPTQEDMKDVIPEINSSLSGEKGTPAQPSSELPTLNDVQVHVHTDAKVVDELPKTPEVHQAVDVETPAVDIDSEIPADRHTKENLITDGEQLVEPLVDELALIKSVERVVQQADLSAGGAPAPELSTETKAVEGITPTPEDGATEDKSNAGEAVLSMQGTPVVHEDESQPAAKGVPSTLEESLTEDEPDLEKTQPVAASGDEEVFAPPVEASTELEGTQEAAIPVGQVEIVEGGKNLEM
jgi:hypothetical protein